eukprot:TRINITY_DN39747_c0_g1_i1.p1 TRINITY_DN39747_c0_g1~~TRINITY_DN39747_c0_g1_i1.p1  ORF type:complete len:1244 (+),score=344.42 TRINITY_DN39747_c0_g1_i1:53-3733(+)
MDAGGDGDIAARLTELVESNRTDPTGELAKINRIIRHDISRWPPATGPPGTRVDADGNPTVGFYTDWFPTLCDRIFGHRRSDRGFTDFDHASGWLFRAKGGTAEHVRITEQILELLDPNGRLVTFLTLQSDEARVRRAWAAALGGRRDTDNMQVLCPFDLFPSNTRVEWHAHWRAALHGSRPADVFPRAIFYHPFWYPLQPDKPFGVGPDNAITEIAVTPLAYLFLRLNRLAWECCIHFESATSFNAPPTDRVSACVDRCRNWVLDNYHWVCKRVATIRGKTATARNRESTWRKRGLGECFASHAVLFDRLLCHYWGSPGQPFLRWAVHRNYQRLYNPARGALAAAPREVEMSAQLQREASDLFLIVFTELSLVQIIDFKNLIDSPPNFTSPPKNNPVGDLGAFQLIQDLAVEDLKVHVLLTVQLMTAVCRALHFHEFARIRSHRGPPRVGWGQVLGGRNRSDLPQVYQTFGWTMRVLDLVFSMIAGTAGPLATISKSDAPILELLSCWSALISPYQPSAAPLHCFDYGIPAAEARLVPLAGQPLAAPCLAALSEPDDAEPPVRPQPAVCFSVALSAAAQAAFGPTSLLPPPRVPWITAAAGHCAVENLAAYAHLRWHPDCLDKLGKAFDDASPEDVATAVRQVQKAWRWLGAVRSDQADAHALSAIAHKGKDVLSGGPYLLDWELDLLASTGRRTGPLDNAVLREAQHAITRFSTFWNFSRRDGFLAFWASLRHRVRVLMNRTVQPLGLPPFSFQASPAWAGSREALAKAIFTPSQPPRAVRSRSPVPDSEDWAAPVVRELYEAHSLLLSTFLSAVEADFIDTTLCTREVLQSLHRLVCALSSPGFLSVHSGEVMKARLGLPQGGMCSDGAPPPVFMAGRRGQQHTAAAAAAGYRALGARVERLCQALVNRGLGESVEALRRGRAYDSELIDDTVRRLMTLVGRQSSLQRLKEVATASVLDAAPAAGAAAGRGTRAPSVRRTLGADDFDEYCELTDQGRRRMLSGEAAVPIVPPFFDVVRDTVLYEWYGGDVCISSHEIPSLVHTALWIDRFMHATLDRAALWPHYGAPLWVARMSPAMRWMDNVSGKLLSEEASKELEELHAAASVPQAAGAVRARVTDDDAVYHLDLRTGDGHVSRGQDVQRFEGRRCYPPTMPSLRPAARHHSAFFLAVAAVLLWLRFPLGLWAVGWLLAATVFLGASSAVPQPRIPGTYVAAPARRRYKRE